MSCINISLHATLPIILRPVKLPLLIDSSLSLHKRIISLAEVVSECGLGMRDGLWD